MGGNDLQKRLFALFSLILFSVLILGYLWWGRFEYHHKQFIIVTYVGALLLVVFNHWYQRDTLKVLGLRADNFATAAVWYGGCSLLLGILIGILGWWAGSWRLDRWKDLLTYCVWAAAQQYLLQNFLRLRSENLLARRGAVSSFSIRSTLGPALLAAALFALYHLPNYPLVAITFLAGLFWCVLFALIPNLFWAWISQAALATVFMLFFKYSLMGQFQVGLPGYRYQFYGGGVKVAAGYNANNQAVIATLPGADKRVQAFVKVFTAEGHQTAEWNAFEGLEFSGEISVGDLGFGPGDEVAVTPGPGTRNPPFVRIFDLSGELLQEFEAEDLDAGYGAWVSIHCKKLYLSPGPGPGRPQQVLEFSPGGQNLRQWKFTNLNLVNGLRSAVICSDNIPQPGASSVQSKVGDNLLMWASDISINPSTVFVYDTLEKSLRSFETLTTDFGVNATLVKLGDNRLALGVAPGPLQGYPPLIQGFDLNGEKLWDFLAFKDPQSFGSNLTAVDINGDGEDELVLGEGVGSGRLPLVRIYQLDGHPITEWNAYPDDKHRE